MGRYTGDVGEIQGRYRAWLGTKLSRSGIDSVTSRKKCATSETRLIFLALRPRPSSSWVGAGVGLGLGLGLWLGRGLGLGLGVGLGVGSGLGVA